MFNFNTTIIYNRNLAFGEVSNIRYTLPNSEKIYSVFPAEVEINGFSPQELYNNFLIFLKNIEKPLSDSKLIILIRLQPNAILTNRFKTTYCFVIAASYVPIDSYLRNGELIGLPDYINVKNKAIGEDVEQFVMEIKRSKKLNKFIK